MKLTQIMNENQENRPLSNEVKKHFLEIVSTYNKYQEMMDRKSDLATVAETLGGITEAARTLAIHEGDDWFDKHTIKRNMSELDKLGKEFDKCAKEATSLDQRLGGLYEDMGHILSRYYKMGEITEEQMKERLGMNESVGCGCGGTTESTCGCGTHTHESVNESKESDIIDSFIKDLDNTRGIVGAGSSDWGSDRIADIGIELKGTKNSYHRKHGSLYDTFDLDLRKVKPVITQLAKKHNLKIVGRVYTPKKYNWKDEFNSKTSGYEHNRVSFSVQIPRVNESVNESASKEAMGIAGFTGTRGSAVEDFITKNELDGKKLFQYVKKGGLKQRMEFVSAIAGNPGNKIQKMIISKFKLGESVNEEEELTKFGESVEKLMEKNVPTNPSKWSYYKAQAKKKFDVYPSAYANGWAAKQYKAAGGGWKKGKSESVVSEANFGYKDSTASYINNHKDEFKVAEKMNKGNEVKFYDALSQMEEKIGHPKFMIFLSNALRGYKVDMYKDPKIKNPQDAQEALFLLSK